MYGPLGDALFLQGKEPVSYTHLDVYKRQGYGSTLGTRRLIGQMRAFRPELVHLHNLHGCYLNLSLLFGYLKDAGLPVVWTLHDCWPFTGHCAYFDYAGCDRWQTRCHDCPQQRGYPVCIGLDGSARNFQHKKRLFTALSNLTFVVPCEWMKQPLGRSFLSGYPVRVIPNGCLLYTSKCAHKATSFKTAV